MINQEDIDNAIVEIDSAFSSLTKAKNILDQAVTEPPPPPPIDPEIQLNMRVYASIEEGANPLPVRFEAVIDDSEGHGLADYVYHFDFDNYDTSQWTPTGNVKSTASGGPIASHNFKYPGDFNVRVSARRISDNVEVSFTSKKIKVLSSDAVFSGNKTTIISMDEDGDIDAGGYNLIINPVSWPIFESNHRYLLVDDHDYSSLGDIQHNNLINVRFGSIGDGLRPIVGDINIESGVIDSNYVSCSDVIFSGIRCNNIKIPATADNIGFSDMIYRSYFIGASASYRYDIGSRTVKNNIQWPTNISMMDSVCHDPSKGIPNYIWAHGFIFSGNSVINMDKDDKFQHCLRIAYGRDFVVENNLLSNAGKTKHLIKCHGRGINRGKSHDLVNGNESNCTSFGVIRNNICGDGTPQSNPIVIQVSPQNTQKIEGVERVVVEGNQFNGFVQNNSFIGVFCGGKDIVCRGHGEIRITTNENMRHMPEDWIDGGYYIND